ncbi:phage major capsid protein [Polaromonas sp.]|uniref:phage major capsid protein n=1 Tax=Polaromonas sp. TaxID=1869339 RepID=UPI003267957B
MTSFDEITKLINDLGDRSDAWRKTRGAEIDELKSELMDMQKKAGRPNLGGGSDTKAHEIWIDTKSQKAVPVLSHGQALKSLEGRSDTPNMGRVLRGLLLGGRAHDARELEDERKAMSIGTDPAGGYTVAGVLANEWIDLLRADMVLSKAGARTVPMESGDLSLACVTGDPVISWHGENANINDAAPTLGSVNMRAKTVVCLVKLSLELSQDSSNIEQILQGTITRAMANAIDSAGINGVSTDAAVAPRGIIDLSGRNTVTSIGAPTTWDFLVDGMYELAADNVPLDRIGALVAHPAVWKKMRKLKTGITNDNTPLTMPAEIAALPKLWTTAAPLVSGTTATGIIADWRDLLFGVRKEITVRVLQETFMGSNLQIAVLAYARVDFAATRAASFCTLEGITV